MREEKGIEKAQARAYTEKLKSALKMKKSGFDNAMIADVLELSYRRSGEVVAQPGYR